MPCDIPFPIRAIPSAGPRASLKLALMMRENTNELDPAPINPKNVINARSSHKRPVRVLLRYMPSATPTSETPTSHTAAIRSESQPANGAAIANALNRHTGASAMDPRAHPNSLSQSLMKNVTIMNGRDSTPAAKPRRQPNTIGQLRPNSTRQPGSGRLAAAISGDVMDFLPVGFFAFLLVRSCRTCSCHTTSKGYMMLIMYRKTLSTSGRSALPSVVTEGSGDLLRSAVLKTCARKETIDAASAPAPSAELKEHLQLPAGDVTSTPR